MNYAIDKAALIRYDLLGNGRPLASLSMVGETGHDPDLKPYGYAPDKARALLKEAGIALPLHLKGQTRAQGKRTARILAKQLEAVGIDLRFGEGVSDAEVIADLASKKYDLGIAELPDALNHISFVQSIALYSKSPFSLLDDPDYDKRLEALIATLDPAEHLRLAKELDRYVHDQALSLFTYQRIRTYGLSSRVEFVPSITGSLDLRSVVIRSGGE
jgi:peptide/nickel transport system substrate-binding protein